MSPDRGMIGQRPVRSAAGECTLVSTGYQGNKTLMTPRRDEVRGPRGREERTRGPSPKGVRRAPLWGVVWQPTLPGPRSVTTTTDVFPSAELPAGEGGGGLDVS